MYKIWPSSRLTVKSNQFGVKVPAGFSSGQWQREKYLSKSSLNDTKCNKQSWIPNTWIICNRESDDPTEKRQSQHKPNAPQPGTVLHSSTRRNNYVNHNLPVTSMISCMMTLLAAKMFELNWTSLFGAHYNWTFNQLKFSLNHVFSQLNFQPFNIHSWVHRNTKSKLQLNKEGKMPWKIEQHNYNAYRTFRVACPQHAAIILSNDFSKDTVPNWPSHSRAKDSSNVTCIIESLSLTQNQTGHWASNFNFHHKPTWYLEVDTWEQNSTQPLTVPPSSAWAKLT